VAGPIEGLVVIDASWGMPGAVTSMVLADYGATVVKVERPGGGPDLGNPSRAVWERGKRSVTLDVRAEEGVGRLWELLGAADVFIESFRPGIAAGLGFGFEQVIATLPRLVYCSISGYGQEGPWRDRPGYDALVAARLGVMAEQAGHRAGPIFLGHPCVGYGTAFLATIGILAAVRARHHTGRGQHVDTSLLDSVIAQSAMNWWWNAHNVSYLARSGTEQGFGRNRIITDLFLCADGEYVMVHTGGDGGFKRTMDVLGLGEHVRAIDGPEMAVPLDDAEHHAARVLVPAAFARRPRAEWLALFHAADLAALPVLRPTEVLLDEQVRFADVVIELPDHDGRALRQVGPVIRFDASPATPPDPAPALGADNHRLAELLAALRRPRVDPVTPAASDPIREALEGLRVLDFSSFFATAYGAKLLADLGADVIKVETLGGDQMRPMPDLFEASNRGKRNLAVDLKSAAGREVVARLVATADVVMHNLRPGKAEKLGIGYEDLRPLNPRLIYCYLPGFGSQGPKAHLKSFAPLVSGFTGLLYEGAGAGNPPVRRVMGNEDYYNGFLGAVGVLLAVEHLARTGEGQYLESPHLHSSLFVTTEQCLGPDGVPVSPWQLDAEQTGFGPLYRLYATNDGWVALTCVGETSFARLVRALGLDGIIHPDATGGDPEVVASAIGEHLAPLSSSKAFELLDRHGVPCEIALPDPFMPELLWDEWAVGTQRVLEQEHYSVGYIREMGLTVRLSDTPGRVAAAAPRLGEHTVELLGELGYSDLEVAALLTAPCLDGRPAGDAASSG
jgi:crotonobetainyl-CoA:carnitine CoA-transferase CaiB-like acyl-CoA transferase